MEKIINVYDVDEFRKLLNNGLNSIRLACEYYVDAITKKPELKEVFIHEFPEFNAVSWYRFEQIGRGVLSPKLLHATNTTIKMLSTCSYSDQVKYLEKPVEFLTSTGDVLLLDVSAMISSQVRQVFNGKSVRTLAEQKVYIEIEKEKRSKKEIKNTREWFVRKDKLYVGKVVFTKIELVEIMEEMNY